jgi:class 3 adenylate cyclase
MKEQQLHERLRELLGSASAESCQVVATFLDIRGFSTFSAQGESFDSALYLRSVFNTILSAHFGDTAFFKPTGDGLLLIHVLPTNAEEVPQIVSSILARAVTLVGAFGEITADDYMINFPVPKKLGVGIARGSATRLVSDGGVLDYTGRCLNLAARLMDKARPSGVVFADSHAKHLMAPEVALLFTDDEVCIRGISEQTAIPIMISTGVEIARSDREPIPEARQVYGDPDTMSVADARESSSHAFYLPSVPSGCSTRKVG